MDKTTKRIVGVLGLQGDIDRHVDYVDRFLRKHPTLPLKTCKITKVDQLEMCAALFMPGGESTTMLHLLKTSGLWDPLKRKIASGLPVFATCAGSILLADDVRHPVQDSLKLFPVVVERNGFGRQLDSQVTTVTPTAELALNTKDFKEPIEALFIRAPRFSHISDSNVKVLATLPSADNEPVWLSYKNRMITSFHPELTEDLQPLEYFFSKYWAHILKE